MGCQRAPKSDLTPNYPEHLKREGVRINDNLEFFLKAIVAN